VEWESFSILAFDCAMLAPRARLSFIDASVPHHHYMMRFNFFAVLNKNCISIAAGSLEFLTLI
jgi:hypothetical protein